jgi:hypothetical protein
MPIARTRVFAAGDEAGGDQPFAFGEYVAALRPHSLVVIENLSMPTATKTSSRE